MFTTLAGFVEAGETYEDAVKREVFEESGVDVDDVQYLKSQPWPFPQSSMIAYRAVGDADIPFNLDEDEIVEAKWFTRDEVRKACAVEGAVMRKDGAQEALRNNPNLTLLVPPKRVVARELIEKWLSEKEEE
jgi:NAD+ diphosphatase